MLAHLILDVCRQLIILLTNKVSYYPVQPFINHLFLLTSLPLLCTALHFTQVGILIYVLILGILFLIMLTHRLTPLSKKR